MIINIIYKVQYLDIKSGFWTDIQIFPVESYHQAITKLYDEYKWDKSRQYRLTQVKEELIDSLFPSGS